MSPEEYWRDNVDLDGYFTFRAVNREVNNMDIRDGWNHYIYYNAETNRFTPIPWDLDMLYVPRPIGAASFDSKTRFNTSQLRLSIAIELVNFRICCSPTSKSDCSSTRSLAW